MEQKSLTEINWYFSGVLMKADRAVTIPENKTGLRNFSKCHILT